MGTTRACDESGWDFRFYTSGSDGAERLWIGDPLAVADTATMRIRTRDGQASEHALGAPGYIVPGGLVDGPAIESITLVAASGEELFHYDMLSPEMGVPPPPPPDC